MFGMFWGAWCVLYVWCTVYILCIVCDVHILYTSCIYCVCLAYFVNSCILKIFSNTGKQLINFKAIGPTIIGKVVFYSRKTN